MMMNNMGYNHLGLGKRIGLNPISTNNNDNDDNNNKKIMQISIKTYSRLQEFSRKHHNIPTSYDDLMIELVDFWNEKHEQKY